MKAELFIFNKGNLVQFKDYRTKIKYYKYIIIYSDGHPKSNGKYSFVEWIDETLNLDSSNYFNEYDISVFRKDVQRCYRPIFNEKYIDNFQKRVFVTGVKKMLIEESEDIE